MFNNVSQPDLHCIADDEPTDGPTCYFIMTGFTSLDLLEQLAPVGLTAHVLINVLGGSAPPNTLTSGKLSLIALWICSQPTKLPCWLSGL